MEGLKQALDSLAALNVPLGHLGTTEVSLFGVLQFVLLVAALFYVSGLVGGWTANRLLARTELEIGVRLGIGAVLRYGLLILGFLVIAQTMGINLTTFNVIAGAVGVGVGFGLQNIVSNFISGLIILFERAVRVGDRVVLGPLEGDVVEIGARRTTLRTDDNLTIIVPNSRFITDSVVNLRSAEGRLRVRVGVQVAPGTDVETVRTLLIQVARDNPEVLAMPPPDTRLTALQPGGALAFELLVWTASRTHARDVLQSALNAAIASAFAANGVKGG